MNTPTTTSAEDLLADVSGPTAGDLAEIEAEAGLLALEVELVDAELELLEALAAVAPRREPSELEVRRIRRAERVVLARTLVCGVARESLVELALGGAA